jgi:hypothetical protein
MLLVLGTSLLTVFYIYLVNWLTVIKFAISVHQHQHLHLHLHHTYTSTYTDTYTCT